tara:strand:- start:1268 stop:1867 length:600 start_codon:yes stop_codon:yes gene_type:complete
MNVLTFYDFNNEKYIKVDYIQNSTLQDYKNILEEHNINFSNVQFIYNFIILNKIKILENTFDNIIIINNDFINKSITKKPSIEFNNKTSQYLSLLQKYNELITFIIILKTDNVEYISIYLEKYRKHKIYNIIKNNQKEIIEMINNSNNNFIDYYIRTCNIDILAYIINYSKNILIISQLENIFPDVPTENIEELIDIFS